MFDDFPEIWIVDFEFIADRGERPDPVCLVAWELRSGQELRLWRDQLGSTPPYPTDASSLFVAYYASAELGCHLALGWPIPARILDLFAEFRNRTNGLETPAGAGLLGALLHFGLDSMAAAAKDSMRALVLRGGPWVDEEKAQILGSPDFRLLRGRRCRADATVGCHASPHRSPARVVAWSLHGCRCCHGI